MVHVFSYFQVTELEERGRRTKHLVLDDLQRKIKVDFRELNRLCKPKHAWARTIHTYQVRNTVS